MYRSSRTPDNFNSLSLTDLIEARDLFHFHLMNKRNVIATAVGRYFIRNSEMKNGLYQASKNYPKPARTLSNSSVQRFSWPCVLVFVKRWQSEEELINSKYDNIIPRSIYMPDGRVVPICVMETPRYFEAEEAIDLLDLNYRVDKMQAGLPVMIPMQGRQYVSTVGCLVTDGHTTYALTNKHVTGEEKKPIYSCINGASRPLGFSSGKVLGKKKFSESYPGWNSSFINVNNDAGLIELLDTRDWNPEIYGLGIPDEILDLNTQNFTLDLISNGNEVESHCGISGNLKGEILALFYRYKSVGGEEYIADFLIGGQGGTDLNTHHGDSGSLWLMKEEGEETDDDGNVRDRVFRRPFALHWGRHEFLADGGVKKSAYALATCLSNVLRDLDIDLIRSWNIEQEYTWGKVGHYTVGNKAVDAINGTKHKTLKDLFLNNVDRISFADAKITKDLDDPDNFEELYKGDFCPLADVPDLIWKQGPKGVVRGQPEHPNHYCDIDYKGKKLKKSLRDLVDADPKNLDPDVWIKYYKSIKGEIPKDPTDSRTSNPNRPQDHWGLLPFRVWQIFDAMVDAIKKGDRIKFFCAAGVLTHYVGDACQPLHGSYMTNGNTFKLVARKLTRGENKGKTVHEPYAKGVHGAYEDKMIDESIGEIMQDLGNVMSKQNKASYGEDRCDKEW